MTFMKVRFVGSSAIFTTNKVYDVIDVGTFMVIDDTGAVFTGATPSGPDFDLESVVVLDVKQLYP